LAAKGAKDNTIVLTENQTEGKGRLGRSWSSEPKVSLTFSLILRPPVSPVHASKVAMIAGIAVAQAIRECTGADAKVKWPNDVLINKRKVCGILTEMSADCDTIEYLVCGIGINVNQTVIPDELRHIATSLRLETGRLLIRGQLLLAFLTAFFDRYDAWIKNEDFTPIVTDYTKDSMLLGEMVTIESHGEKTTGQCVGFDKDGFLVIEKDGKRRRIMAGDVSLRSEGTYV
jgi:BirA family biotin operon repressor/biotin-[acetyl-CoA-carboxylase] ligase